MTGVAPGSTVCVLLILGVHPGWWAGPLPRSPADSDLSRSRCLGGAVRGGWPSSESMGVSPRWAGQDRGLRPRPLILRGIRKGRDETQHVGAGRAQGVRWWARPAPRPPQSGLRGRSSAGGRGAPSLVARGWQRGVSPMCSCFPTSLWPQRGGRCGRGPTRRGRAEVRTPLPQHGRPPLCLVPRLPVGRSGAPAVPVSTWARGAARGASRHQPQLQVCAACPARGWPRPHTCRSRRCALRAREPRPCSPGPGPPCRPGGSWLECGQPAPFWTPALGFLLPARGHLALQLWILGRQLRPVPPALLGAVAGWGWSPFLSHVRGCCWGSGSGSLPGPPSESSARWCGRVPPAPVWRLFPGLSSTWPQQGLRSAPPSPWHRAELTQEVSCRPHPAVPGRYARPAMPSHLLGPRGTWGGYYGHLPGAHLG